uniref:Protein translocase subunit SecY n=1 Tax=Gelidium vagum TaxID=35171 RepID=A0A141SED0_GELVA|nr:preprotein translocase subunit SecY [Gelidium vagum]AMK96648.1 preprotein translocase subunit SecY [Gelidium vagum]
MDTKAPTQLQKKIITTVSILLVARLGIFIPLPGIDHTTWNNNLTQNSLLNFLNLFAGGGFTTIGIFALGIVPYINASIVIQLMTKVIPKLENLQKEEGELGRQHINQITRYITVIWAILQSLGIAFWLKPYVFNWNINFTLDCIFTLTTGSVIIMWFSEVITEYGIGNGASLLIFQNIVSGLPKTLQNYQINFTNNTNTISLSIIVVFFLFILVSTIAIQEGKRKISIISAKQLSKTSKLNPQSYIPLKINQGGVMPIIFASAAIALPPYLLQATSNSILQRILVLFIPSSLLYLPLYCLLIISFSYFYSSLILNPIDIAKNLKKMGASIPGIRPGVDTTKYLNYILSKLTFLGAIFLFIIALIPAFISIITNNKSFQGFGATSLLILVGVAIDTAKQIQTYIISQQYDNMME